MRLKTKYFLILSMTAIFMAGTSIFAAERTATFSGNWSNTATWGGDAVPTADDDVTISSGVTVTVDVSNAVCLSLTMEASGTNSVITISGTNTLSVSGLISLDRPTAGESTTINVNAGTLTCGSIEMNATNIPIFGGENLINITSGTFTVNESFSASGSLAEITLSGAGNFNLGGSVSGSPTLNTVSGSNVNYSGSSPQNIIAADYGGDLTISGSELKSVNGAISISGTLFLLGGTMASQDNLTLADGATIFQSDGSLFGEPDFAGTIDLEYSGASSITSSYEMPIDSDVLNDLTINSGGVTQGLTPGATTTLLEDAFRNTNNWTGDIGSSNNEFRRVFSSNAGGATREVRYTYGSSPTTEYTASIYRVINTSGYVSVNISWKQFIDNFDADSYPYTIKVQTSTSDAGPWTDLYSFSPSGSDNIGPVTERVSNWTTDLGGDMYLRFYITGFTYGINYWYIDDLLVEGQDPSSPSTVTVNGTMDLSAGGYTIGDNTLVIAGDLVGSNTITGGSASNLSVEGSGTNVSLPAINGGLNNFTINRTGGVTLGDHLTVNGVLNLQSANPSATQGTLETGNDTLTMALAATSTGDGDVTGFVKRTSFNPNTPYSFGNQYTTISFTPDGTLPSSIVVSISIGTSPTWFPAAIEREYDFVQAGGSGTNATIATHYLDTELNGISENDLEQYTFGTPGPPPDLFNWGKTSNNTTNNWVSIADIDIGNFPTSFNQLRNTLGPAPAPSFTWNGGTSDSWNETTNWTPNGIPGGSDTIVIPDATTTTNDPLLPGSTSVGYLRLESGSVLNAGSGSSFTINGSGGAWLNDGGTFNPSTSNVIFTNINATISGTNAFYDITVADGAKLTPTDGSYMQVANSLSLSSTGVLEAAFLNNTIDYNGSAQTVIIPNGSTPGYHSLVLSGSGTKTMPGSNLNVTQDFSMSGTASATLLDTLSLGGSLSIGTGTSMDMGAFTHSIGGDLTVTGGTLTSASTSLEFDGTAAQTITSSSGLSLDDLVISNTSDTVSLGTSTDITLSGDLQLDGVFDLGSNVISSLAVSMSGSGTILTQNTSATPLPAGKTWSGTLVFNGSSAQTIVAGTYNNLTVRNPAGISAAASLTANGTIELPEANPSASQGLFHLANDTITLGPSATNTGVGEITGIMKRTGILPDTEYSYGHPQTYVNFPDVGALPTELYVKLSLGTAPAWLADGILRIFDIAQTGGSGTQAELFAHYLDSELNGNREEVLVDYVNFFSVPQILEYGRSAYDTAVNQIGISNVNIGVFAPVLGFNEIGFDEPTITTLTWTGDVSTSWVTAQNWSPVGAPSDSVDIIIPDASTTPNDLTIPAFAICKSITIESGGIVNAAAGSELTLTGDSLSWVNEGGTFNPGTSTVIFNSPNSFLTGSHEFHDILIESEGNLRLDDETYLGITGSVTTLGSFQTDAFGTSTVEYKGADQTVGATSKTAANYGILILSGSGTKNLPDLPMTVDSTFTISGTANAVADTTVTANDVMTIESGATFTAGSFAHTINADFTNNGTLTATNSNFIFGGSAVQTISGSSTTTFDSLTINNSSGVTLDMDNLTTVSGALEVNTGGRFILPPAKLLTVSGTLSNLSDSTGILLQSDATGSASLINSTAGAEASVERYMVNDHWHIVSPAVSGQSIPGFVTNADNTIPTSGSNYGMMFYSEPGGGWQFYTDPASGDMGSGTGYLIRHTVDDAVTYYGDLTAATVDMNITRTANGWNCIGNPFPSSIGVREDAASAENFLDFNASELDPSYAALYVWDEPDVRVSGVNYYKLISNAAFSHSKPVFDQAYLQPGQGFILKSAEGGSTVSFTQNMRIHETAGLFVKKAQRPSWPGIILEARLDDREATTSIAFHPGMTTGLDITYDAGLLGGDPKFKVYTHLVEDNGISFMLQCLPEPGFEEMVIPVGLDVSLTGKVQFSAEMIDLPANCEVFLEDRKNETFTDLGLPESAYKIQVDSAMSGIGRFYLHLFEEEITGLEDESSLLPKVYTAGNQIYIQGDQHVFTDLRIIDLSGRIMRDKPLENSEVNIVKTDAFTPGVYFVQLRGKSESKTYRIFVGR